MIYSIILCAIFGIFILISFTIGLSFGVKLRNNEKIELPKPIATLKKHKEIKQAQKYIDKQLEEMQEDLKQIESYDGNI